MTKQKLSIRKIEFIIGFMLFIIFAVLISWALHSFYTEGERHIAHLVTTSGSPDHIEVVATVKSVDPIKGDVLLRLAFEPRGNLIDQFYLLTQDIYLYVNNASGSQEFTYRKGKLMYPMDVTLNLFDGSVADYPFDSYKTELLIDLEMLQPDQDDSLKGEDKSVTLGKVINFTGTVSGYKIGAQSNDNDKYLYSIFDIEISRSGSVKFFSVFVMVTMWSLTILTILLVLSVLTRKRKVEISMFAFTSVLLFALPALRNMQPLAPPIGAFSDYVAFFWAESIAALALITLILTWLIRPQKSN